MSQRILFANDSHFESYNHIIFINLKILIVEIQVKDYLG